MRLVIAGIAVVYASREDPVVVVGAGMSGLAAARAPPVPVHVYCLALCPFCNEFMVDVATALVFLFFLLF